VQVVPEASPNLPPPPPGIVPNPSEELPPLTNSSLNADEDSVTQDSVGQSEIPTFSPLSDPEELLLIDGLDEEFQVLKIRDQDTNMILDMIQLITDRYILRPQNLPAVKITFDSMAVLTKRETLLAVESLLAMNGVAITKIDDKFYKAVPAQGANVHVPIWLDAPASTLRPSQRIYMKLFRLKYAPALEVREQLNAFATPNVSSLIAFEKSNSILITDSLLNLQRIEDLLNEIDKPVTKEDLGMIWEVWEAQYASAKDLETKLKALIEGSFKSFLGGTTQVDADERTGKLLIVTRKENWDTIEFILNAYDARIKKTTTNEHFVLQHADAKGN
jgi:general secretion pathway protein D